MRSVAFLLLASALLGTRAVADEDAPWLDEVSTEVDRAMLVGLLDPDEDKREGAAARWEEERVAFLRRVGSLGPPRDELDPTTPRNAYEARKVRITNGFVRALKKGPPLVRRAACRSIADLHPAFRHGREALGKAIDDEDPRVRAAAIQALCEVRSWEGGRRVLAFLPQIIERLLDLDREVRFQAMEAVGYLVNSRPGQHEVIQAAIARLVECTKSEDGELRAVAYRTIGRVAPSEERTALILRNGLDDEVADVRRAAAERLVNAMRHRASKAVLGAAPRLRALTADAEFGVRWAAANALWEITEDAEGLVPICAEALERFEGRELACACRLICEIGPVARSTAPALVTRLGAVPYKHMWTTGLEPYEALLSVGPELEDVRSAIAQRLGNEDPDERGQAMQALETVHATAEAIADLVLAHLDVERDARVRIAAMDVLAKRAPDQAGVFVPELCRQARSDDEEDLPWMRVELLGRIGSPEAIACVGRILQDRGFAPGAWRALFDARERATPALDAVLALLSDDPEKAAPLLARMGPGVAPAVPSMLKALAEAPCRAVPDLCEAIRQGGGAAAPCVKALLPLLARTEADDVRTRAIRALGGFGEMTVAALPTLERIRDETEVLDREGLAAAVAAACMGGSREKAIERGLYNVRHSYAPVEGAIRELLPILGPEDAEAVPDLVEAALLWRRAFHKPPDGTLAALEALGRIGQPAKDALPVIRSLARNVLFKEAADSAIARIAGE